MSASAEVRKKVDDNLTCEICHDTYTEPPKLLQCHHVFCKECLERLLYKDCDQSTIPCPTCRSVTVVPSGDISCLQSDFHMEHLFEIRDILDNSETKCGKCESEKATLFCHNCEEFICRSCGDLHKRWRELKLHDITPLDQMQELPDKADIITVLASKQKHELAQHILPLQEQVVFIGKALESLNSYEEAIGKQQEAAKNEVSKHVDDICHHLNERKRQLHHEIDGSVQQKLQKLATQRKEIQQMYQLLTSCLKFAIGSLHVNVNKDDLGKLVVTRIKKVMAQCQAATLQPEDTADITVTFPEKADLVKMCLSSGNLPDKLLSAEKTTVSGDALEYAEVDESVAIVVHARDTNNKEYKKPYEVTAKLTHIPTNTNIECVTDQQSLLQCNVLYKPTHWGKHELQLLVNKKEIKGNPFTVRVLPGVKSLACPSRTITDLKKPQMVATNSKGYILVTESGAHRISVFNREGQKEFSFGTKGSGNQQFGFPCGITVDENDNIYVTDSTHHRIQKFTAGGNFVSTVGCHGSGALYFSNPRGIGYNKKNNNLYVCEESNKRIQVLDSNLTFCRTFGTEGGGSGQLKYPYGIDFDEDGTVVVVEYWSNQRVQLFSPQGKYIQILEGKTLCNPICAAVDSAGSIYVSEKGRDRISVFDKRRKFVTSFGSSGSGPGQFCAPNGIHIDCYDNIYVADTDNGRIQIFS